MERTVQNVRQVCHRKREAVAAFLMLRLKLASQRAKTQRVRRQGY